MDNVTIGWICIGAVFVLLALGMPVAFALAFVGFAGYYVIVGLPPALGIIYIVPYAKVAQNHFIVLPLFILMGNFAFYAGFGRDIFWTARQWIGRLPGGLSMATVAACAGFGAACGSSIATAATFGKIAVPEMARYGYDRKLAFGSVAASGTLAAMIPPSSLMVLYGIATEQSVGKLLIAGVIPGLINAALFMILVYFMVRRNPALGPPVKGITWADSFRSLKGGWSIIILIILVIGGIYSGIVTATEAAALGAFGAFVLGIVGRRLSMKDLWRSLLETGRTTAMLFAIIFAAFIFSYQFSITNIPFLMADFLTGLQVSPIFILIGISIMYIILGCFLDGIAMLFLTIPIIFPTIVALGYDPIWFGVILVHLLEVALITPPFALNIFVLKSVVPDSTLGEIIQGIIPFLLMDFVVLGIFIAFPIVALFLPNMM